MSLKYEPSSEPPTLTTRPNDAISGLRFTLTDFLNLRSEIGRFGLIVRVERLHAPCEAPNVQTGAPWETVIPKRVKRELCEACEMEQNGGSTYTKIPACTRQSTAYTSQN